MAITIQDIRLDSVSLEPDTERGGFKINSSGYSLISSAGKVLAKQTIGGYGGVTLNPSPTTQAALDLFVKNYLNDVRTLLGFD